MKKEFNFLKAKKNPYFSKLKNMTLQEKLEKLENLPLDRKKKIKQRANELILDSKSEEK